ncbi:hypothetical protein LPC08_01745 [Roseomonas sp. OT10]|uniref:hypothetical protein n=1 Tax=Roseomonas cutis TaxID=2897332 RepID=UPI001E3A8192|nr:hypothetical protein [Roseomonas sp. OT10]UFN49394.1 hypothetical protein LPC08_01745 [Roseomonas sp. OT10]
MPRLPLPPRDATPDLLAWCAPLPRRPGAAPRVILLPDAAAPDGLPRAGLLHPGHRLPVVFPSLPAALAALRAMEAHP